MELLEDTVQSVPGQQKEPQSKAELFVGGDVAVEELDTAGDGVLEELAGP